MNIYFSFSLSQSDEKIRTNRRNIITVLQETGSRLLPKNILDKITHPNFYTRQTDKEKEIAQKNLIKSKKSARIIILETSFSSTGIGQELEYSVANNKPVLALYHEDYKNHILVPHHYDNFLLLQYNDKNIKETLFEGLEYLKKQQPKRFNLLIEATFPSTIHIGHEISLGLE